MRTYDYIFCISTLRSYASCDHFEYLSLFECKQWKPLDVTQYLPKNDAKFENKHLAYKIQ